MIKIIDEKRINGILEKSSKLSADIGAVREILAKAGEMKGLDPEEAGVLLHLKDPELTGELFNIAARIKEMTYGERLVFFAPLYISDFCINDCDYCNFHTRNKSMERKKLTMEEIEGQARFLINMGHKRLLLECGEDPVKNGIDYVVDAIDRIYSVKTEKGNIRRINVNIAATTVDDYKRLKAAGIGTYQLFQETYHRDTYEKIHNGPKADYDRQLTAHIRAFEAGLDDLGLGALFGLYDWRFEVLALVSHAIYMDGEFGVGPHTFSVPRFRPAPTVAYAPQYLVPDSDFLKIIAILRAAVPYTGMIISTREKPEIRKEAFRIGISQASACSVTSVGGYGKDSGDGQFKIYDERPLIEIIEGVLDDKLLPSFCTACYRSGRTGKAFMDLAKPGDIHNLCRPNALLTFAEYLEDFVKNNGDTPVYRKGYEVIGFYLNKIENKAARDRTAEKLNKIKEGRRDVYF